MKTILLSGMLILLLLPVGQAQGLYAPAQPLNAFEIVTDTVKSEPKGKSPKIAAICSIIPGGGQIYNGKYWKVPVVYGVLGGAGYWLYSSHSNYIYYRDEYRLRLNGATEGLNPELANMSTENVASYEKHYQRNQELGLFLFLICYGLNMVDAMVDAHFSTYDVSDNLTLALRSGLVQPACPSAASAAPSFGLQMVLKF